MSKRSDNRRENLRRLIEDYDGPKELAIKLGYRNASFLVQMAGPNPTRDVTEKSARKFERTLGLEDGSLDWPPDGKKAGAKPAAKGNSSPAEPAPQAGADTAVTVEIIRLMGKVCEEENVALPPVKFADAVAFAIESGLPPSAANMKRILALINK